jgi:taurine transport system substrate-binding protein
LLPPAFQLTRLSPSIRPEIRNFPMNIRLMPSLLGLVAAATLSVAAYADPLQVTIGYQTNVTPAQAAITEGAYEKASGANIDWRKFDTGPDVVTAVASGDVQIGYVGSSPTTAAISHRLPIEIFYVAQLIGTDEALVVRNGSGIVKPSDLVGKKIAVPFISTSHYSLLAALKHWNIASESVQILNLRPPEIAAAWARGDIDGAYVWDPALTEIKATGSVLASSADVGKWGAPTFDVWVVRKDFAAAHPDFVTQFVKVTSDYKAE